VTNLAKSAIALIRCENLDLNEITLAFPCQVADFPCKYLGLPLSQRALKKADWQPQIDELA
jgi:hypothetical protein